MPNPSKVVTTSLHTLKLSLEEIEANLRSKGLFVEMDEDQLLSSDSDEADVQDNLFDTAKADSLLKEETCETSNSFSSSDSGAVSGEQLALDFAAQQNGIAGSTSDISDYNPVSGNGASSSSCSPPPHSEEVKKNQSAVWFGPASGNPDANGESKGHSITAQTATQLQNLEQVDTSKPISNLGNGFAKGKSSSSLRNLSVEDKKQQRVLRFGTTSVSEIAATSGQTSKVVVAEGLGNSDASSDVDIKESATSREANASKHQMESSMEAVFKDLEANYENHRDALLQSNGLVSTPLHALKECAAFYTETIHQEITCLPIPGSRKPMIRTEIIVGRFKGTGEAYDRRASTQMAALDILQKMKVRESGLRVVPFGLLPGWRISPRVSDDLFEFCSLNGLQAPRFVTSSNVEEKDKPVLSIECFLGSKLMSRVDTDVHHYGRKQVAAQTLEQLTGEKYPTEYLAFGVSCMGYKELVDIGFKPVMSDRKRTWILEQFEQYGEAVFRYGVDRDELHSLQVDLFNINRIQENGSSVLKRSLHATASTNGDNWMCKRKLRMANQ